MRSNARACPREEPVWAKPTLVQLPEDFDQCRSFTLAMVVSTYFSFAKYGEKRHILNVKLRWALVIKNLVR